MKQFAKRFLTNSQWQFVAVMKSAVSVFFLTTFRFLGRLILFLPEWLGQFGINILPAESRARILGDLPFTREAKFHPRVWCYISNDVEYRRSKKVLSSEMLNWINGFKEGDNFYDIGANIGMFSLFTAKYWHGKVEVIAFEPSFSTFTSLMRNVAINHLEDTISCFQIALGKSTRLGKFNYTSLKAGAALHTFDTFKNYRRDAFTPVFQQPMLCYALTDFIKEFDLPIPTHIKLDVDGTELEILHGAESILKNSKTESVMIEIVDLSEHDERTLSIIQFFNQLGYKCQERFLHSISLDFPRISDYFFVKI